MRYSIIVVDGSPAPLPLSLAIFSRMKITANLKGFIPEKILSTTAELQATKNAISETLFKSSESKD